jgi:hypothetical protein
MLSLKKRKISTSLLEVEIKRKEVFLLLWESARKRPELQLQKRKIKR